jgi:4-aminobutyrate aminotransferase-like enzyme
VACAAALATIDVMEELDLNRRATEIGARVRARFQALAERIPHLADVRGLGAMVGAEFLHDGDPASPATAEVSGVVARSLERGVLIISAGTYGNVLRILSPLVIDDALLERGLDVVEGAVLEAFEGSAVGAVAG